MDQGQRGMKMTRNQVLYLSYDGLTDPLGQSQILPYLVGLSAKGYSITVVTFEKKDKYAASAAAIQQQCDMQSITWIPMIYHKWPPVLSTVYDLLLLYRRAAQMCRHQNFSIVHCRSYLTALAGMRLKKKYGLRFIFDMRGFWVDERIEGGLWNIRNPLYALIYKFFKRKEKEFVRDADRVIVLTDAAKEELQRWNLNEKISTIPCCVDLEIFDPGRFTDKTKTEIRAHLKLPLDNYTLLYLGSLGTWYLYPEMVSFFRQLKKARPAAKFLFLTPDVDRVDMDPDFIVRTVSKQDVPMYILASDASVCFIKPSFSKKGSSATKMAEVLAMGVPMVSNGGWGDMAWLHQNIRGLYVVESYQDVPVQMFEGPAPGWGQEFFAEHFSLSAGVTRYAEVYELIIHN